MQKKLSTLQLALISTGGMLGCGWLFSPFYGYQTAGIGVLFSWAITAIITLIIGLSFAEVCCMLPLTGGIYRLMGITHNKNIASAFLLLGWLSYVVYLPLEAQAVIQYLGFWLPALVTKVGGQIELSWHGIFLAVMIILGITWFNTMAITRVAKVNNLVSLWKILVPIMVALIAIVIYGSWDKLFNAINFTNFTSENVLLAVTSSGLAFAFSGFQNGLLLARQIQNPTRAIPYSLFCPIIIGVILYSLISLSYLTTLNGNMQPLLNATAPLLGLLSLLGLHVLFTVLFIDAVIAPLGTTNVYIAGSARVLYGVGKGLFPKSILVKLNQKNVPYIALWINAAIGIFFLFPFPTWKQLVNFLSSIVVFAYLAGPISLLVLRKKQPNLHRAFKLKYPYFSGILGFVCCSWLIYWSGLTNLGYLCITLIIILLGKSLSNNWHWRHLKSEIIHNSYLLIYLFSLWMISWLRFKNLIPFPMDCAVVGVIGMLACYVFLQQSLPADELAQNIAGATCDLE